MNLFVSSLNLVIVHVQLLLHALVFVSKSDELHSLRVIILTIDSKLRSNIFDIFFLRFHLLRHVVKLELKTIGYDSYDQ